MRKEIILRYLVKLWASKKQFPVAVEISLMFLLIVNGDFYKYFYE